MQDSFCPNDLGRCVCVGGGGGAGLFHRPSSSRIFSASGRGKSKQTQPGSPFQASVCIPFTLVLFKANPRVRMGGHYREGVRKGVRIWNNSCN